MARVTIKSAVRYAVLPGLLPRFKRLFASGFGMIAYLVAHVYGMVRLLPPNHAYLRARYIGQFSVRQVIAEAANHLKFEWSRWDQISVFALILCALVLIVCQVALVVVAVLFDPVWADTAKSYLFTTPAPRGENLTHTNDVAFLMLDRVFGIPGFFCAADNICTDVLSDNKPWPFHKALHSMLEFYSGGISVVAVLIFLYFIVVVVGETVTAGTPFGERFQNVWVPIRLVIALLMLTPVSSYGLNVSQYITLWTAKAGSGFATNGWHRFNTTITKVTDDQDLHTPIGEGASTLLSKTYASDITPLLQGMMLVHGCALGEWSVAQDVTHATPKYDTPADEVNLDMNPTVAPHLISGGSDPYLVRPYLVKSSASFKEITSTTTYAEALQFYNYSDVLVSFGRIKLETVETENENKEKVTQTVKTFEPVCGEIVIPTVTPDQLINLGDEGLQIGELEDNGGAPYIQGFLFYMLNGMWFGSIQDAIMPAQTGQASNTVMADSGADGPSLPGCARGDYLKTLLVRHVPYRFVAKHLSGKDKTERSLPCKIGCDSAYLPSCCEVSLNTSGQSSLACEVDDTNASALQYAAQPYQSFLDRAVAYAHERAVTLKSSSAYLMTDEILNRGWGGAGIWFNRIGRVNGDFVSASQSLPYMSHFPAVMEEVKSLVVANDASVVGSQMYNPTSSKHVNIAHQLGSEERKALAQALYDLLSFINGRSFLADNPMAVDENLFMRAVHMIFGTRPLMDMRSRNNNTHPIAQLSALGKGIVNSAMTNIGAAMGLSAFGGVASTLAGGLGDVATTTLGGLFNTTAYIGLTAGIALYYVIPILPFLFFFFAVGGWVKGLFEAMVGVPLWALAHLRIDGEGLPGEAASSGYFLLLELFIRPMLIVFGLIAGILLFSVQVQILNFIWDLVIENLGATSVGVEQFGVEGDGVAKLSIERGAIDHFFFTVLYAIIVYMMATVSFKMIDLVPDNISRWMGAQITAFGEGEKDQADAILKKVTTGGMVQGQQLFGAARGLSGKIGPLLTGTGARPSGGGQQP